MAEPQVRASMPKDFLAVLDEHYPQAAHRVRKALPPHTVTTIESASRVEWLHLRHHAQLNETSLELMGLQQYQQAWRQAMLRSVQQKTLRATVTGALRLFGATPASLMKLAPRAWNLLSKNAGRLSADIDVDAKQGRLTLTDFPEEQNRSGNFAQGLVGCIESFLDISETQGEVRLSSNTPTAGRATYEVTWR